ncbi:IgGFc-binding protein-like [Siniperca chuatsi]|uniref:IgGFc-binding protein-like n=1 Tax=Siniperca chuatsi TaxID=119488 RepID=UPI001CE05220|nr:IgGFc-binding protein-like [Siniperca chuatsi]
MGRSFIFKDGLEYDWGFAPSEVAMMLPKNQLGKTSGGKFGQHGDSPEFSINASSGKVCSEGCFCDEGFLRSGKRCVPVERCGCQYDGFYYKKVAPRDVSAMLPLSCAVLLHPALLHIRNGQLGCFDALSTCTVWGDPHYITLDGAMADFPGTCSYTVATNNHCGDNRVSFVSAVDIYLSNQPESAYIRIEPNKRGRDMVVDTIDLIVQFDGQSALLVRIGQNRENGVTGMEHRHKMTMTLDTAGRHPQANQDVDPKMSK